LLCCTNGQVAAVGLEQPSISSDNPGVADNFGAKSGAVGARKPVETEPMGGDLEKLAEALAGLSPTDRQRLLDRLR